MAETPTHEPKDLHAGSLNADHLRGRLLMTFLTDRLTKPFISAGQPGTDPKLLNHAIADDAADLASELPEGVELRGARISVGRGAGTVLPAIEIFRSVTDDAVRITVWVGFGIAFAKAVKRAYVYVRQRIGERRPLVSPEVLIQLAAAELLESNDPPEGLQFGSIMSIRDLRHVYSTYPYLPYDYTDVYVIVLTAGEHVYGFVVAADGTISHQWHVRLDSSTCRGNSFL